MDSDHSVGQVVFFPEVCTMFFYAHIYLNNIRNTLIKQGHLLRGYHLRNVLATVI